MSPFPVTTLAATDDMQDIFLIFFFCRRRTWSLPFSPRGQSSVFLVMKDLPYHSCCFQSLLLWTFPDFAIYSFYLFIYIIFYILFIYLCIFVFLNCVAYSPKAGSLCWWQPFIYSSIRRATLHLCFAVAICSAGHLKLSTCCSDCKPPA